MHVSVSRKNKSGLWLALAGGLAIAAVLALLIHAPQEEVVNPVAMDEDVDPELQKKIDALIAADECGTKAAIFRYFDHEETDHMFSADAASLGASHFGDVTTDGKYKCEGKVFYMYTDMNPVNNEKACDKSLEALHAFYNEEEKDHNHMYSLDSEAPDGYKSEGVLGYCSREQDAAKESVPLFVYRNEARDDDFFTVNNWEIGTTTEGKLGRHGYTSEGVLCFVYEKPKQFGNWAKGQQRTEE